MQGGGTGGKSVENANPELVPGAAVGLALATGDIDMTSTGTVTYRYGNKLVAYPCSVYGWYSQQYQGVQHCTLAMSGTSDSGDSLDSRPVASNYDNADCYISLHTNGLSGYCTGAGCPTGTATYYDTSTTHATWTAVSKTLAQDIQTAVVDAIRTKYSD
jgi:hypothetical protein